MALLAHADHRFVEAGGVARSHRNSVPEGGVTMICLALAVFKRLSPGDFPRHPKTAGPDNNKTVTKHANRACGVIRH